MKCSGKCLKHSKCSWDRAVTSKWIRAARGGSGHIHSAASRCARLWALLAHTAITGSQRAAAPMAGKVCRENRWKCSGHQAVLWTNSHIHYLYSISGQIKVHRSPYTFWLSDILFLVLQLPVTRTRVMQKDAWQMVKTASEFKKKKEITFSLVFNDGFLSVAIKSCCCLASSQRCTARWYWIRTVFWII